MPVSPPRSPALYRALRAFCLAAFFKLGAELERGADIPVVLEEHAGIDRPALYEYRPLVGSFVEAHAEQLARSDDAQEAINALKEEPAAGILARAYLGERIGEDDALRRTVLVPLLVRTAEVCNGFDWDDRSFDRAFAEIESTLFGDRRHYVATTPLIGLTAGSTIDLGRGITIRPAALGEFAPLGPDAQRLLPHDFGREVDRSLVLQVERTLDSAACRVPEAARELARVVSALRLVIPGSLAAGPVLFERLDGRPYGVEPVPSPASQQPPGEPNRIDPFRAELVARLQKRLIEDLDDSELLEALDRWELALFHSGPQRADELREALESLLGGEEGAWAAAMRASVLLGDTPVERNELLLALRALLEGDGAGPPAEEAVRRSLVEVLLRGPREELLAGLDGALLGVQPRPQLMQSDTIVATV